MDYYEFLETPIWARIRARAFDVHGRQCAVCLDDQEVEPHHLFYPEDPATCEPKHLMPLCRRCHREAHQLRERAIVEREEFVESKRDELIHLLRLRFGPTFRESSKPRTHTTQQPAPTPASAVPGDSVSQMSYRRLVALARERRLVHPKKAGSTPRKKLEELYRAHLKQSRPIRPRETESRALRHSAPPIHQRPKPNNLISQTHRSIGAREMTLRQLHRLLKRHELADRSAILRMTRAELEKTWTTYIDERRRTRAASRPGAAVPSAAADAKWAAFP